MTVFKKADTKRILVEETTVIVVSIGIGVLALKILTV